MAVGGGMARILGGIVVRVGGRIMWFDWGMSGEVGYTRDISFVDRLYELDVLCFDDYEY